MLSKALKMFRGKILTVWFILLLVSFLSLGIAYSLLTPGGEGIDEAQHWSYTSQLATRGQIPNMVTSALDGGWQKHHARYPVQYQTVKPFTKVNGINYRDFFEQSKEKRTTDINLWYSAAKGRSAGYYRGTQANDEGQHPPLYYLLTVPFYVASKGLSYGNRVNVIRLASVFFAFLSVLFLWLAAREYKKLDPLWLLAFSIVVLTPSFYFDFARLGNDSLCICIGTAVMWLLLRAMKRGVTARTVLPLAIALGIGVVTKAFFLGVTVGVAVVVMAYGYLQGSDWKEGLKKAVALALLLVIVVVAISGWWFVRSQRLYGDPLASFESLHYRNAPSLNISAGRYLVELAHGYLTIWRTHVYSGAWSFVGIPYWMYIPFALLWLLAAAGVIGFLLKGPPEKRNLAIVLLVVVLPLVASMISHINLRIFKEGAGGGTPGYYLFFLWMAIYGLIALGLTFYFRWRRLSTLSVSILGVLMLGMWLVSRFGDWTLLMTYSGIGTKMPNKMLGGVSMPFFTALRTGVSRLGELVPVAPGLIFYFLGVVAQLALILVLMRYLLIHNEPEDLGEAGLIIPV